MSQDKYVTNNENLSLPLALWLADQTYDPSSGLTDIPKGMDVISMTTLLKPTRAFVLAQRVPPEDTMLDVLDLVKAQIGHAIHTAQEDAWTRFSENMKRLRLPKKLIDSIVINPVPSKVIEGMTPVYIEKRSWKEIDGVAVTGQLDLLVDGELNDTKTTSVFAWMAGTRTEDHRLQLSGYRWMNPDLVTSDTATVNYVFTDWNAAQAKNNPKYPPRPVMEQKIELYSPKEIEAKIRDKIREIRANVTLTQKDMVRCTESELWRSAPVWKYYSDPEKAKAGGRATKNFDDKGEAHGHLAKAGKGVVVEFPGEVRRCGYCAAFPICEQKDEYFNA